MTRERKRWPLYAVLVVTGLAIATIGNILVLVSGDGGVLNVVLGVVAVVCVVGLVLQLRRDAQRGERAGDTGGGQRQER